MAASSAGSRAGSSSGSRPSSTGTATVVVYSQDPAVRAAVRTAVGRRPAPDSPRIDWVECGRFDDVIRQIDLDGADLLVLDGDAQPTGGIGLSRQLKSERDDAPPVVVLLARAQDGWLASWALVDATISRVVDPVIARDVVADLLRRRSGAGSVVPHVR